MDEAGIEKEEIVELTFPKDVHGVFAYLFCIEMRIWHSHEVEKREANEKKEEETK